MKNWTIQKLKISSPSPIGFILVTADQKENINYISSQIGLTLTISQRYVVQPCHEIKRNLPPLTSFPMTFCWLLSPSFARSCDEIWKGGNVHGTTKIFLAPFFSSIKNHFKSFVCSIWSGTTQDWMWVCGAVKIGAHTIIERTDY